MVPLAEAVLLLELTHRNHREVSLGYGATDFWVLNPQNRLLGRDLRTA